MKYFKLVVKKLYNCGIKEVKNKKYYYYCLILNTHGNGLRK